MENDELHLDRLTREWDMDPSPYEFCMPCNVDAESYDYIYFYKLEFLNKCKKAEADMYKKIANAYKSIKKINPEKFEEPKK
jgi:hypothetical protein